MYSKQKLEFNKIKELIASYSTCFLGKEKINSLRPSTNLDFLNNRLDLIDQFQSIIKEGLSIDFEELGNLEDFFAEFKGHIMSFEEFSLVVDNVRITNNLIKQIKTYEGYKLLKKSFERLTPFPDILDRFNRIFSPDGDILDNASSELLRIRKSKRMTRNSIQKTLSNKLNDPKFEKYLQEKIVTTRGDRYVVPIKEGKVKFVGGVVQERSTSGASIFVEPPEIVEMNNKISMLKQNEKEEIYKIFTKFTKMILPVKDILITNTNLLAKFDFYYACAFFSNNMKANRVNLVKEPVISLKQARHPLLIHTLGKIEKVIPFDLEIGDNYNLLILSGPNTGGKTVTLKSTGLLTMMALSGLPISADKESTIGCFDNVFADIGDEQSLESSLSTFSSHITNIMNMVNNANNKTLILIDEIGSSTDPEQGSALAQAVLEKIESLGAKGIITTHFTALKVFAEKNKTCRNASMQFDGKEHKPTFRFVFGLPGDSFAIDVAEGLGLDNQIVKRSKFLAGTQNVELTNLIKKLEEEKKKLAKITYEHELQVALLKGREDEYKKKIKILEDDAKNIKRQSIKEAQQYLIDMQKELNRDLDSIKKLNKEERKKQNAKILDKINHKHQELKTKNNLLSAKNTRKLVDPKIGMRVWVENFECSAVISNIKGKKIEVDMDGITFKTDINNISYMEQQKITKSKKEKNVAVTSSNAKAKASFELKLLGLTFDESVPLINEFIDNASLGGLHKLRIVHGKGTGALRVKVRQHLKRMKTVKSFFTPPQNEGGSGVTIVEMKEN